MTTITIPRALLEQALEALTCNLHPTWIGLPQTVDAIRAELAKPEQKVDQNWNMSIRDSVDALLAEAGYKPDSSARHQLAMMNFDQKAQSTPAWHDAPTPTPATAPAWHDAPTVPGLWLAKSSGIVRIVDVHDIRHLQKYGLPRWFGPLPEDKQ